MSGGAERGKGPGLIGQDFEQSSRDGREVAGLGSKSLEAGFEKTQEIVERVIHDPHAGRAGGQLGKALGLGFELEQGALVEGRASGEIAGGDGLVEEIEQLLVIGSG